MNSRYLLSLIALYLCIGSIFAKNIVNVTGDSTFVDSLKSVAILPKSPPSENVFKLHHFSPDPGKAVWYSALFPGLGQIYNRKYWKLPLIYAGFAGLSYGLSWNNQYLKDYSAAFNDISDNDPATSSYLDILPASYTNGTYSKDRLTTLLKSRKDYFRRNRDLTIISMVGLYFVCMIDAYVDAQLFEFDISPDLSLKVEPSVIRINQFNNRSQGIGLQCSINF